MLISLLIIISFSFLILAFGTISDQFLHSHKETIEIFIAAGAGMGAMFTNIELGLRIIIGFLTIGYISWKWICAYADRKHKREKNKSGDTK